MYKRIICLFIFALLSLGTKCEDDLVAEFYLHNNTKEKIYFKDYIAEKEPDEISFRTYIYILPNGDAPNIFKSESFYYDCNKKLYVFFCKQSTVDKYGWEEINEKHIYDAKLVYTFEELKAMNFIITYNGD